MKNITISAEAFKNGENIPVEYTCDGKNISPELSWDGIPAGTKSLALIMDDPDAPMGTFVHWVLFNIPVDVNKLPKGIRNKEPFFTPETHHGVTGFAKVGYGGPCPPSGVHRYYFRIYALDIVLNLKSGTTRKQLDEAMKEHILATGELFGLYKRI
jgi:Raf kinase inhibitor-like YbhB/YbcL family protein